MTGLVASIALPAVVSKVAANAKADWAAIPPKVKPVIVGLLAAVLLYFVHQHYAHKAIADAKHEQFLVDKATLDQTVANYRAATERAQQLDAANVARVKADQAKINQESSDEYEARIADARARADKLRRQLASEAHPGSGTAAPMSGLPAPSGGSAQGAGQDGLSIDERLTATEQAIQLDELIKWVRKQAGVDVNGKQ